jgi:hypothetical protein
MLGKSDWLALVVGTITFGGGLYMGTLPQRLNKWIGIGVVAVGAIGLLLWFSLFRHDPGDDIKVLNPFAARSIFPFLAPVGEAYASSPPSSQAPLGRFMRC